MEAKMVDRELAVLVRNAYKRFSPQTVVLRGLNMSVQEGTIYGLLGPSGCGKTTLLRCILGRARLDAGEIAIKAKQLKHIGYMPQGLALHKDMTIAETFNVYGRMLGMTWSSIEDRGLELLKFLDLPDSDKFHWSASHTLLHLQGLALHKDMTIAETFNFYGRVLGMAWSSIEDRGLELLKFLDLPDSNKFIGQLSGGQMRRVSLSIALLHDPQILILDEPTAGVDPVLSFTIWERLLKMAENQRKTIIITTHYIEEARNAHTIGLMRHGVLLAEESPMLLMANQNCSTLEQAFLKLSQVQHSQIHSCDGSDIVEYFPISDPPPPRPVKTSMPWSSHRFLAQLLKNFIWNMRNLPMLAFTLLLPLTVAVLSNMVLGSEPKDLSLAFLSAELPDGLSSCDNLPAYNCSVEGPPLSCSCLHFLRLKNLNLVGYEDMESGLRSVERGESWGFLYFPHNYTRALIDRVEKGQDASDEVVDTSLLEVSLDMSNLWISTMVKRDILYGVVDYLKHLLVSCNSSPELADLPLKFLDPVHGLTIPKFVHFCTPGLIISFCFYLPIMFTTGAIMMEKQEGLLERSLISAFLLAVFFESEKLATYAGVGTIVLMFIICGIVWPYQGMHWLVRLMVSYSPLQPAVESYRAIAERAWGLDNSVVSYGFLVALSWLLIFTLTAYFTAKRNKLGT